MENFPRPRVPLHPILSSRSLTLWPRSASIAGLFDSSQLNLKNASRKALLLTSGRMAIAYALQHHGIGPGDKVLIPAYHCSSMVEPVVWLGATPVFFRIQADGAVDLADVAAKIDIATKMIIVTHYFGFHQDMTNICQLCAIHHVAVLEDCAHAAFGEFAGLPLGSFGDYAIASALKFYPVYDGGCLYSSKHDLSRLHTSSAGLRFNLKAFFNTLEKSFAYQRLALLKYTFGLAFTLKDWLWRKIKSSHSSQTTQPIGPAASEGGFDFDGDWVTKKISWISNQLLALTDTTRLIEKRRQNYLTLHHALRGLHGTQPLFAQLPDTVVPYVYPLIVFEPEKHFASLKRQAVPILRFGEFLWDGVTAATCSNSDYLSRHVFQFPCHQELTTEELDWIIRCVRQTLSNH